MNASLEYELAKEYRQRQLSRAEHERLVRSLPKQQSQRREKVVCLMS